MTTRDERFWVKVAPAPAEACWARIRIRVRRAYNQKKDS